MEKLNTFIVTNKPALEQFYDKIVSHPEHGKLADCNVRLSIAASKTPASTCPQRKRV